jgi:hypothetical protein
VLAQGLDVAGGLGRPGISEAMANSSTV